MNIGSFTRRLIALVAVFTVLMLALAPTISNAIASASAGQWSEICMANGISVSSKTRVTSPSLPEKHDLHSEHCPYCVIHADSFALPPVYDEIHLPLIKISSFSFPRLYYQASRPLFAWSSAQPRAPPYSS